MSRTGSKRPVPPTCRLVRDGSPSLHREKQYSSSLAGQVPAKPSVNRLMAVDPLQGVPYPLEEPLVDVDLLASGLGERL